MKPKLTIDKFLLPEFGYGVKHYSGAKPCVVLAFFESIPDRQRDGLTIEAKQAYERVRTGKGFRRVKVRGCYWVVHKI